MSTIFAIRTKYEKTDVSNHKFRTKSKVNKNGFYENIKNILQNIKQLQNNKKNLVR